MITYDFDKVDFYQSKYEFYKKLAFYVVVIASLSSIAYYVSDCQLIGSLQLQTLLPRSIILLPMAIYIVLYRKTNSYRIMVPASYMICHLIMWNTIWAITYLPDKAYVSDGFTILLLVFLCIGFCASFFASSVAYLLFIVNIMVSNLFNHYEELDTMLSVLVPCLIGIWALQFFMEKLYHTHYNTKNRLKYFSMYDSLTDVYNRNVIPDITDEMQQHFADFIPKTTGILLFDIDHFKNVNDTYGHANGDIVLKSVAYSVKKLLSKNDYIIRWGGEEFVVILPGSDATKTATFAHTVREVIEHTPNNVTPVTVSVGVSMYDGKSYKNSIDNADKALYKAKESGRNVVIVYEDM